MRRTAARLGRMVGRGDRFRPRFRPGGRRWTALALAAFGFTGAEAGAQELRLGASKNWADLALLGDPVGISVGLDLRIRDRVILRFGYEHAGRNFHTVGSTCVGLIIPPTDCRSEPRDERSRVRMLSVGLPLPVYRWERAALHLVPNGRMAAMSSRQHGERTDRTRSAEELMAGLGLGLEVRIPVARSPSVSLTLGTSTEWFIPWRSEAVMDGYTPFDTSLRLFRVEGGLSVLLR